MTDLSSHQALTWSERALPRGWLRTYLLLRLRESPSHGYELLEALHRLGFTGADTAAVYRTLRSMDRDNLVQSWWERSPAGPPRRIYELTSAGMELLDEAMAELDQARRLVSVLLDHYETALPAT